MKLVITADLHYDITRSVEPTRCIAEEICGLRADALLLLGDAGGRDVGIVRDCLHLFDRFRGPRFFVAGNHDVWTDPGESSLDRFERVLPRICGDAGFHPLDLEPAVLGHVGLVGSMAWYDYSYRPVELEIPIRFYEHKLAPGAAARLPGYEHLVADASDIPEAALSLGTRWTDGEYVRLGMSDAAFNDHLLARFREHLAATAPRCDVIVAGLHHVPFAELLTTPRGPSWAFGRAFMGSAAFGRALLDEPKARFAFCGHSHAYAHVQKAHVTCTNLGCTYTEKRYEILNV